MGPTGILLVLNQQPTAACRDDRRRLQPRRARASGRHGRVTSCARRRHARGAGRRLPRRPVRRTVDAARALAAGRVLAGERRCLAPPGFDQGNSPREALRRRGASWSWRPPTALRRSSRACRHRPSCWSPACSTSTPCSARWTEATCSCCARAPTAGGARGRLRRRPDRGAPRRAAHRRGAVARAVAHSYATPHGALAAWPAPAALRARAWPDDIDYCAQES